MSVREQRLAALGRATEVRIRRMELKRELKAGRVGLGEALEHPASQSMLLFDLLCELRSPSRGRSRVAFADWLMSLVECSSLCRVGDLTDRQRRVLIEAAA